MGRISECIWEDHWFKKGEITYVNLIETGRSKVNNVKKRIKIGKNSDWPDRAVFTDAG